MKDSSSSSSAPLLGLRMKASSSSAPQLQVEMDHDVMLDMLAAMTAREQTYKCDDYLTRHRQQTRRPPLLGSCSYTCSSKSREALSCADTASSSSSSSSSTSSTCSSSQDQEQQQQEAAVVDATCREKMCEWSYRVCDHFHTPREIVAFSMSFLDRFVDRFVDRRYSSDCRDGATTTSVSASCCCDRTTFKLASMTTLYLATKVFNGKQISIGTLAELSRGEFDVAHIAEMERSILETLDFRLSPPTIQAFIGLFIQLIPASDDVSDGDKFTTAREIYQRAIFFAELCAYDYSLILHDRSLVAVAAILNAIEGGDDMEDPIMAEDMRVNFLESVNRLDVPLLHIDEDDLEEQLESTQARLWYLYSCSAQEQAGRGIPCGLSTSSHTKRMIARHHHHHEDSATCNNKRRASHHHSHSPVSVITATTTAT